MDGTLYVEDSRVFNSNLVLLSMAIPVDRGVLVSIKVVFETIAVVTFLQPHFPNVNVYHHHKVWKLLLEMV